MNFTSTLFKQTKNKKQKGEAPTIRMVDIALDETGYRGQKNYNYVLAVKYLLRNWGMTKMRAEGLDKSRGRGVSSDSSLLSLLLKERSESVCNTKTNKKTNKTKQKRSQTSAWQLSSCEDSN